MTINNSSQQPIDPDLQRRLQQLRSVPSRNPEAAARSKAKFIAEVDEIVAEQGFSPNTQLTGVSTFYQRWKEKWIMATPRTRLVFTFVTAFVLVAVFLFGGAGMTAYAAQSALPGDALYGVKTSVEQTRVTLAGDAAEKARLNLAFAERRLDEIARLIENGRYVDIAQAVQEYEKYVQSAIAELATVAAGDPTGAQELASQVAVLLNRYAQTLSGMVSALPDTARTEVEHAIQVSNTAGNLKGEVEFVGAVEAINPTTWVVAGRTLALTAATEIKGAISVGSLVKVHAWEDANGGFVLREVELASDDDLNENGNFNGNANDDDGNLNGDNDGNTNGDDDDEFSGIVEQIGAGFWVIGGRTLAITAGSEIEGGIDVGDFVKVEFVRDASGNLVLREVDLVSGDDANSNDDDDMNDNDDNGVNDNDDDGVNDNDDDGVNDNDDDMNDNDDDDMNDNDDDSNSNVNQNSNDNDDDDDNNDNDDDDSNDNDDDDDDGSNDNDDDDDDDDD